MPGNLALATPSIVAAWPAPNFIDPVERTWLPPLAFALLGVSTLMVFVRLGLRLKQQGGGLGLDDAFLLPAWFFAVGFTICAAWSSYAGIVSRHIWDVRPNLFSADAFNTWFASAVFLIGTACLKISILFFYRRIQSGTYERKWLIAVWAAIVFTACYTIGLVLALVFNCNPTEAYWKAYDPTWTRNYRCADTGSLNLVAGLLSVLGDLYAFALPCLMLQNLNIPRRQKIGLNAVFALSLVSVGAGGARAWAFYKLSRESDSSWIGFWVYFTTTLEYELGIICTCSPSMRVFIKRYLADYVRNRSSPTRSRGDLMTPEDDLSSLHPHVIQKTTVSWSEERVDGDSMIHDWRRPEMDSTDRRVLSLLKPVAVRERSGIRTPKEYEEFALQVVEKSRRSLMLGSVKARADHNKSLPPLPSPRSLGEGLTALPHISKQMQSRVLAQRETGVI